MIVAMIIKMQTTLVIISLGDLITNTKTTVVAALNTKLKGIISLGL